MLLNQVIFKIYYFIIKHPELFFSLVSILYGFLLNFISNENTERKLHIKKFNYSQSYENIISEIEYTNVIDNFFY